MVIVEKDGARKRLNSITTKIPVATQERMSRNLSTMHTNIQKIRPKRIKNDWNCSFIDHTVDQDLTGLWLWSKNTPQIALCRQLVTRVVNTKCSSLDDSY
nr:hypothetical protein BgiMline_008231 [Biomphalaria glabrata]